MLATRRSPCSKGGRRLLEDVGAKKGLPGTPGNPFPTCPLNGAGVRPYSPTSICKVASGWLGEVRSVTVTSTVPPVVPVARIAPTYMPSSP